MSCTRILSAIKSERWAIQPAALETIISIAQRLNESPEAVSAKLGRPLCNAHAVTVRDGVAVVPISGPIFRYANLFTEVSGATSVETSALAFQAALDDPAVNAIILDFDTPGGMVSGISEFAAQIRAGSEHKRVIGYVSNMAASAGYWLVAACSEIVASDTAMLGSIGVVMSMSKGADDGTIKFISAQSPLKHADPATEAGMQVYQSETNSLAQIFVDQVAAYRGVSVASVLSDFGRGGVLVGKAAVDAHMADRLGSLEGLISEFSTSNPSRVNTPMTTPTSVAKMTMPTSATRTPARDRLLSPSRADMLFTSGSIETSDNEAEKLLELAQRRAAAIHGHQIETADQTIECSGDPELDAMLALVRRRNAAINHGRTIETADPDDEGSGDEADRLIALAKQRHAAATIR